MYRDQFTTQFNCFNEMIDVIIASAISIYPVIIIDGSISACNHVRLIQFEIILFYEIEKIAPKIKSPIFCGSIAHSDRFKLTHPNLLNFKDTFYFRPLFFAVNLEWKITKPYN